MKYVGLDLGTSSLKLVIIDEQAEVVFSASSSYENRIFNGNWSEQNPDDWIVAMKELFKQIPDSYLLEIEAISFSGQMHGLVLLDDADQLLRPAILWNDQRSTLEVDAITTAFGADRLGALTANRALVGFTAPKVMWVKQHEPEIFARIAKIMLPKDYLIYILSGLFASDMSDSSGTLYFNVRERAYAQEILDFLGITQAQLPHLYESYEVVGQVKAAMAKELGLKADVKVIAGGGDQAVGAIGSATTQAGDGFISLGTSGVLYVANEHFCMNLDRALHTFCDATGHYHQMGVMLNAAGALDWVMTNILQSDDFTGVLAEVTKLSYEEELYFLPYLIGERTPVNDANAKGIFYGLTLGHNRYHLVLSVLEGVGYAFKQMLSLMPDNNNITSLRIIGGGAKSSFWIQLLADILQIPLTTLQENEGASFGAALLAYAGANGQDIGSVTKQVVLDDATHYPDPSKKELYERKFMKYNRLYKAFQQVEEGSRA